METIDVKQIWKTYKIPILVAIFSFVMGVAFSDILIWLFLLGLAIAVITYIYYKKGMISW